MSLDSLQERLSQLQETTAQLKELIDRLASLRFQPGSAPLDASVASITSIASSDVASAEDGQNVAAELAAEIAQVLREEEDDLELLREEAADVRVPKRPGGGGEGLGRRVSLRESPAGGSEAERAKGRLKEGVKRLEDELKSCRVLFRKAQLSARRSLDQAQKQERALLLASYAAAPPPSSAGGAGTPTRSGASSPSPSIHSRRRHNKHHQQKEEQHHASAEASASAGVTAALRQMHALAATEVARSEFAQQALADSTAALGELGERYGALGGALAASRAMVGRLLSGAKSDTWFLETALWVLCATAAWILFRRLLYGPLWLLVWWPVRTGWRVAGGALGMVGSGSGGEPSMVVVDGGTRVVGMSEGTVPTVNVGVAGKEKGKSSTREGEEESMVDKVGRVVDGDEGEGDGGNPKKRVWEEEVRTEEEGGGNPKKRMWEEDKEAAKAAAKAQAGERARDEL